MTTSRRRPNWAKILPHLLSGAMARSTASTIMYPVDVIKTRLQFQRQGITSHMYKNGLDAFLQIRRLEGFRALYVGLPVRLFYTMPAAAVSFAVYEQVKYLLQTYFFSKRRDVNVSGVSDEDDDSDVQHTTDEEQKPSKTVGLGLIGATFLAGAGARVLGTLIRTPFDLVKQRMQVEGFCLTKIPSSGSRSQLSRIGAQLRYAWSHGGFFQGYRITLCRDMPFAALYFTSYELSKKFLRKHVFNCRVGRGPPENKSRFSELYPSTYDLLHLTSGAIAGVISTTCTIPMDVVKTRLQTNPDSYAGMGNAFATIWREEGARAFTKGLGPRIAYLIPAAALTFTFYEKFKAFFSKEVSTWKKSKKSIDGI